MVKCGDSAGMEILKKPVKQCILTVLQVFKYGAYGIRTHGLNNANVARSQLR